MSGYVAKRLALAVPTVLLVSLMIFSLVRLLPGDVVLAQLQEAPDFKQEDVEQLREELGLNDSWYSQYAKWVTRATQGDLGRSLWTGRSNREVIVARLPTTLELAVISFLLANGIGLVFGALAAVYKDRPMDHALRILSVGGLAVPGFWLATLIIVFGSKYFGYVPPLGQASIRHDFATHVLQFGVPALILAISGSASITRLVRSSMLEVLRQDYIRAARAKGLHSYAVIARHAMRNALLPVLTLQGLQFASLMTGAVVLEIIFGLSGLGRLTYEAIMVRDYSLLQGIVLIYAVMFVGINLIVDLLYSVVDPRIRY